MREMLRGRWVLGTAVLVVVLAVGVASLLIVRALSRNPWPTTDRDYDACTLVAPDDFGDFRFAPLTELFGGQGPTLVSHSVEPMETSGELGESCVYSSKFDDRAPRFQVRVGPSMNELPDLEGMRSLIGPEVGLDTTLYLPKRGTDPVTVAVLEKNAIIEVSAINFPKGLKGNQAFSSGVNNFARTQTIAMSKILVNRLNVHALPLTTAEGVCRQPDDADLETALGKKVTFSRSVNHDDYDHCAYTSNNGTKLTVRIERGRPSSSRPPGDSWHEVDGTPNTYHHDNQVAVVNPKQRSVAYLQVTSPDGETQERNPQDLANLGKQLLATGGS